MLSSNYHPADSLPGFGGARGVGMKEGVRDRGKEGGREGGRERQMHYNDNVCSKSFIFMILNILKGESVSLVAILKRPHLWPLDRRLHELRSVSAKGSECVHDN